MTTKPDYDADTDYVADTEEVAVQEPKKVKTRMRKPETWKRTITSEDYNSGKRRRQGGIVEPRAVKGEFSVLLSFACLNQGMFL